MKELIGNLKEKLQLHITYQVYIELAKNLTLYLHQHQNINLPVLFMVI